jgi:hypothetical protein
MFQRYKLKLLHQNSFYLFLIINQNTGNGTLLDPVLISADCNVTFSEVTDVCREKSDHNATKISLQIPNYLQKTKSAISSISLTNVKKDSSQLNCLINLLNFSKSAFLYIHIVRWYVFCMLKNSFI